MGALQRSGFIPTESGLRLFYEQFGDGPDVVVTPAASWLDQDLQPLASPARTLIFFDSRGRGASDPVTDAFQLAPDYELRDLETVRQFFGLDKMSLLGWSLHATAVARYAAANSGHVQRLILMCPGNIRSDAPYLDPDLMRQKAAHRMDPNGPQKLDEMKQQGLDSTEPELYCKEHQKVYLARQMVNPAALARMQSNPCRCANEWPRNLIALIQQHPAPGAFDWREIATRIQAPTLVIHGMGDLIPISSSVEWADTIPNAQLTLIEGAGHYPHLEEPAVFFAAVEHFLAG